MMDVKRAGTLVRIRGIEEEIERSHWAAARRARIDAEQRREAWGRQLVEWNESLRSVGVFSGNELRARLSHLSNARVMHERLGAQAAAALAEETAQQTKWQEAKQREEGVIRLHDKVVEELRLEELQREQALIDDITSTRVPRRRS